MFSTAAAAASRPKNRLAAMLGRVFATEMAESRERRPQNLQRLMYYTKCAPHGTRDGQAVIALAVFGAPNDLADHADAAVAQRNSPGRTHSGGR
jgi:hypothetical protein